MPDALVVVEVTPADVEDLARDLAGLGVLVVVTDVVEVVDTPAAVVVEVTPA